MTQNEKRETRNEKLETTRILADWLVGQRLEDIPQDTRHEALRSIVNIVGCAVGGSTHAAVDIAWRALGAFSGPATAQPLARAERMDPFLASLLTPVPRLLTT